MCDECDDLNRAASEGRAFADQSSLDAENSSATRPTQATGTLNNNNTVNNNDIIIDEMLCLVQNKIDTLPPSPSEICVRPLSPSTTSRRPSGGYSSSVPTIAVYVCANA